MGKTEGHGEQWHGHVTAVTVAPTFRRLGLARKLMDYLEDVSERLVNEETKDKSDHMPPLNSYYQGWLLGVQQRLSALVVRI